MDKEVIYSTPEKFKQPALVYLKGKEYVNWVDYYFEWEMKVKDINQHIHLADLEKYSNLGMTVKMRRLVKAGYNTDKASVPRLLGLTSALGFSPHGEHEAAALLHDRGYEILETLKGVFPVGEFQILKEGEWIDSDSRWTRSQMDELFKWMCRLGGMSKVRSQVEYWAVRINPLNWGK